MDQDLSTCLQLYKLVNLSNSLRKCTSYNSNDSTGQLWRLYWFYFLKLFILDFSFILFIFLYDKFFFTIYVGLIKNPNVPQLVPNLLPRKHSAHSSIFLSKWVSNPPSHNLANHMRGGLIYIYY